MTNPFGDRVFAAVLFDLDGTLIDSSAAVERSWKRWGDEYQLDMPSFHTWHGRPAAQIAAGLLPPEQRAAGVARIEEIEIGDVDDLVALPGAERALAGLAAGHGAIVTSCTMPLARVRLGAASFLIPDVVVTADQVTNGKPDPEPFLLAAQRLGVDPAGCLVVEDAPAGLAAAAAAGMTRLAVTTTHDAAELDADLIVPDLGHVSFVSTPSGVVVRNLSPVGDNLTG